MFFMSDSHSITRGKNGNASPSGTTVLLKVDTLLSLEKCIKAIYYSNYPLTMYYQLPFAKFYCFIANKQILREHLQRKVHQKNYKVVSLNSKPKQKTKKTKLEKLRSKLRNTTIVNIHSQEIQLRESIKLNTYMPKFR